VVSYELVLLAVGVTVLGAVVIPRLLTGNPLSFPMICVFGGMVLFSLPLGIGSLNPIANAEVTEHITELVVIIALMGAGLKIDRPFDVRAWSSTWRLLGIVMPLTILGTTLLGLWVFQTLAATAVLFGAVIAPTDPVLASEVQASPPLEAEDEGADSAEQEGTVRFGLTSEAGLNDGLAFPFTNLAIAMAAAPGATSLGWLGEWFLVDVVQKIVVGVVVGYLAGRLLAWFIFRNPATTEYARIMEGVEALAVTLLAYAAAELAHGYGFIAVFVAALELRHYEWNHEYHVELHDFAVLVERLLMAAVLILFGGAIVGGLFAPLTGLDIVVALVVVFVVRPLAGVVGLIGFPATWGERFVISAFGIRGVGSFYYLAHALNEASFQQVELLIAADKLWAVVGFIVFTSIISHGIFASPVMAALDRRRGR
jgi:NhaP-type Na+/H+ or K+/H+ antiporter